jgi:2-polyprenyl-6-methoxyphenol hydroxylase-like FAD-dependent oxidoreductase
LLLHAQGHQVEVLEAVPDPVPVGAGILLQPTGMSVLSRLGLLDDVLAQGARIERLDGVTAGGRRVLDLSYADLAPGLFGLGLHRGALFLRFYATASRWLTPAFQSSHGWLAPPRDALTQPLSRVSWIRRQMLASLAGVKTGVLGSMSLGGPQRA